MDFLESVNSSVDNWESLSFEEHDKIVNPIKIPISEFSFFIRNIWFQYAIFNKQYLKLRLNYF